MTTRLTTELTIEQILDARMACVLAKNLAQKLESSGGELTPLQERALVSAVEFLELTDDALEWTRHREEDLPDI